MWFAAAKAIHSFANSILAQLSMGWKGKYNLDMDMAAMHFFFFEYNPS